MSEIDLKIEELRNEIHENLKQRETVWQTLGYFLLEQGENDTESDLMQEYRAAALEINSRISLMNQQIQEISDSEASLKSFKNKDEELKERRNEIQKTITVLQESLGEELFHLVNSQDLDVPWKKAFDPVFKAVSKLRDNETELYQAESAAGEKNLFKGLVQRSRMTLLKNKKKTIESSRQKLYQKCFADALQMGAGQGDEESKEAELLAPWFRADKEWQSLLENEAESAEGKASLKERMKELSGARGPKKRIEFLQKEIETEQSRLDEALRKWGESVTGDAAESLLSHEEVAEAVKSIDSLTEAAIAINLNIDKWEARKEIEQLSNDQSYMQQKIETLEEEIQARRQEIRVLKKEITAAGKTIEKKKAFAGDEE